MKRFFIYTVGLVAVLAVGWHYVPADTRGKAQAFLGAVVGRNTQEIRNIAAENILPQDPKEKQKKIIEELKKNMAAIKRRAISERPTAAVPTGAKEQAGSSQESVEVLIDSSDKLLQKLEDASGGQSFSANIADRIVGAILPPLEKAQCRQ